MIVIDVLCFELLRSDPRWFDIGVEEHNRPVDKLASNMFTSQKWIFPFRWSWSWNWIGFVSVSGVTHELTGKEREGEERREIWRMLLSVSLLGCARRRTRVRLVVRSFITLDLDEYPQTKETASSQLQTKMNNNIHIFTFTSPIVLVRQTTTYEEHKTQQHRKPNHHVQN